MKIIATFFITTLLLVSGGVAQVHAQAGALSDDLMNAKEQQDNAFIDAAGLRPVSPSVIVAQIISVMLSFLGLIFIVLIIYAGFRWMTSAGNEDTIAKAKQTMTAAIIGLVIVILAFAITQFVISSIIGPRSGYYEY